MGSELGINRNILSAADVAAIEAQRVALALKIAAGGNISYQQAYNDLIFNLNNGYLQGGNWNFSATDGLGPSLVCGGDSRCNGCISLVGWTLMEICSYLRYVESEKRHWGFFSTFLWTAFLVTFITQSSLGLGHKAEGRATATHIPRRGSSTCAQSVSRALRLSKTVG